MKEYLKLIRIPNLIFIAAIQLLMYYCVIIPILGQYGVTPSLPVPYFVLLVVTTVFIAAGGYIINDYFDMKIDEINRPITRIVGKSITRKQAITLYMIVTGIGIIASLFLSYYARSFTFCSLFLIIVGLLWFYSSSYKRILVLGNAVVSLLAAMVPFIVALFQNRFMILEFNPSPDTIYLSNLIMKSVGAFAFCAFFWTFIREIVKDMEDEKGDREMECHSFPIVLGYTATKWILYFLIVFVNVVCGYWVFALIPFEGSLTLKYYLCGMVAPSIGAIYFIAKSNNKSDYRMLSQYIKIIMLLGVCYSLVIWYLI